MESGKGYLVFTLQHHYAGECAGYDGEFIVMRNCSIIFQTGNLPDALKTGKFAEAEFLGEWKIPSAMISGVGPMPILDAKPVDEPARNGKRHAGADKVRAS